MKEVFTNTVKVAQLFRNTDVANDLLSRVRISMEQPPQTVKSYSRTRGNRVDDLFDSVFRNKEIITSIQMAQKMGSNSDRVLDLRPNSKASAVVELS